MYVVDDAAQVRAWDEQTCREQGLTSLALMERAARTFAEVFVARFPVDDHTVVDVLCGPGNNGGDGAAIARLLEARGYEVHVWGFWADAEGRSLDLVANWGRLAERHHPRLRVNESYQPTPGTRVIVDALFGVGLSRMLSGAFAKTVVAVNERADGITAVSVDVPSGQRVDGGAPDWSCVHADLTATFGSPKQACLLRETGAAWGEPVLLPVGLAEPPAWATPSTPRVLTDGFVRELAGALAGPRRRFTHKGTYGHVLVLAGSRGHAGAALLAGCGAYHAGCGLVTFHVPSRLEQAVQIGLPEAMCFVDPHDDHLTAVPDLERYDAVVVGPGIGQHADTRAALTDLFERVGERPVVIDADALNLVAAHPELRASLPPRSILTPHPGEFARLAGAGPDGYAQLQALRAFAKTLPAESAIVLKGQYTAVAAADGRLAYNFFAGNPGMASGGMGDVLAGCLAGLAARSADAYAVACLGVLAHARAGDLTRRARGEDGVLAGGVAERLGLAMRTVATDPLTSSTQSPWPDPSSPSSPAPACRPSRASAPSATTTASGKTTT